MRPVPTIVRSCGHRRSAATRLIVPLLACAALVLLSGCASTRWVNRSERFRHDDGYRSPTPVALESQTMQRTNVIYLAADGSPTLPWYASRNDAQRAVYGGYQGPTYDWSDTRTYDRQYQSSGRVYDYTSINTYRRTITQTTR